MDVTKTINFRAIEQEFELSEGYIWQSMHTPLYNACVKVAREVAERFFRVHCE